MMCHICCEPITGAMILEGGEAYHRHCHERTAPDRYGVHIHAKDLAGARAMLEGLERERAGEEEDSAALERRQLRRAMDRLRANIALTSTALGLMQDRQLRHEAEYQRQLQRAASREQLNRERMAA